MDKKLTVRATLLASAFVGGVICILADLIQKSDASAILLIGKKLGEDVGLPYPILFSIGIILVIASSLPLIFDSPTKKGAFYAGASVLAILMTITPYDAPPGLKTTPNSVEVNLTVKTKDGKQVKGAVVTVAPLDRSAKTSVSRSRMQGSQLRFYLDGGTYRVTIELKGYETKVQTLRLREGEAPKPLSVTLRRSSVPLFIQRILR